MSEKQSEAISFINSDKFGVDTWMTLSYFAQNSQDIISTIELYGTLIERLEEYNLLKSYNARDVIRLKQQIVLDVILKTQILIESTMVLIHSLSVGYHTVAKNMTFYDTDLVISIISELRKNKKLKNYRYNMRKVLGLPNLKFLSLSSKEREFLKKDFEGFQLSCLERIKRLVIFYDKFGIVYGKSKHGLAYTTGGMSELDTEITVFDDSSVQCYSRIDNADKMPDGYLVSHVSNSTPPMRRKYFNFVSVLTFRKELIEEINSAISDLKSLISFMCTNHAAYGSNCGKIYLPYNQESKLLVTSRKLETENDIKFFNCIAEKILPKMYLPSRIESVFNMKYANPQIVESITKNTITNILISK